MLPDERFMARVLTEAASRARRVLVARAIGWGAVAGAVVLTLMTIAGLSVIACGAVAGVSAMMVVAALLALGRRTTTRASVVRQLEQFEPSARNLLITANEIASGTLTAAPTIRARVFADAARVTRILDVPKAFPFKGAVRLGLVACAAWLIVAAAAGFRSQRLTAIPSATHPFPATGSSLTATHVTVTIEPPAYTGLPARTLHDPEQIDVVEGTAVTAVMGQWTNRTVVAETGYLTIGGDESERRTIPVVVTPDALPAPTITAPGRDLILGSGNPRVAFDVRATDDFGLRALSLHFTRVSGSGEQFAFEDGEIPLTITRQGPRAWMGGAKRSIAELNLNEGDMLVYRAVATDTRPGGGSATSDAFFIEISKLGVAAGDAFTLPEQDTRYALSQQMLIVKTARLNQRCRGARSVHAGPRRIGRARA